MGVVDERGMKGYFLIGIKNCNKKLKIKKCYEWIVEIFIILINFILVDFILYFEIF